MKHLSLMLVAQVREALKFGLNKLALPLAGLKNQGTGMSAARGLHAG